MKKSGDISERFIIMSNVCKELKSKKKKVAALTLIPQALCREARLRWSICSCTAAHTAFSLVRPICFLVKTAIELDKVSLVASEK